MAGSVLGMQATEVMPPARAAAVPLRKVSSSSPARLPEVDVHVDQTGADDHAGGVQDLVSLPAPLGPEAEDLVPFDPEIGELIHALRGIDNTAIAEAKGFHGNSR